MVCVWSVRPSGISPGGTRLIFDGSNDAATMSVNNGSAGTWLMRFWVSPYGEQACNATAKSDVKNGNVPFVITPPLYRLEPQGAVQLRVNRVSDTLPADRESVYYLSSLAIPPKKGDKGYSKAVQSGLQFAVNTRIKLFYRPAALKDDAVVKALPGKLMVSTDGKTLSIKNPTPYYITMLSMTVNGKSIASDMDTMVAPFGTLPVPLTIAHGKLTYSTVDNNGARTPVTEKSF
ncbi:fimbrial biogenesis chaperone [Escherichia coli]|uniref:fimbrial biogenesis chaperone n=1 Tax=Escherichia coli TaxID=562 RepID=UPI000BE197FD|nr:molecular chaperone [Escherichia coli]MBN6453741.1 molecular chaperone [Escherichia coli]